jgi:phosphoribosylaminoimidazole-succinocarboxamide synthase
MHPAVWQTEFSTLRLRARGKVRDIYELDDRLLIVATDRLSAFDVVLPTPIPDKGRVLTQLSLFWFDRLKAVVPHHVITAKDFPAPLAPYRSQLAGRAMLVRRTEPLPIECVVRGYLSGSGWKDYKSTGAVCGIQLPEGLRESDRLPEPIFTPATKATTGHDENISFDQAAALVGGPLAEQARAISIEIYKRAAAYALDRGIIIADTKFEFGTVGEASRPAASSTAATAAGERTLIWIDEALTPDSSRFWPADGYAPGRSQPSFDKQFVRDYLEKLGWNKQAPGPELPADIVAATRDKYREAYRRITGADLP